eukprot:Lithocolla_globosa_v1_NODE_516_length_3842_cov_8.723792.p3 type:complete len:114 gc:universal NODE_516_length_3842_cov_8.723792:676-335(-)
MITIGADAFGALLGSAGRTRSNVVTITNKIRARLTSSKIIPRMLDPCKNSAKTSTAHTHTCIWIHYPIIGAIFANLKGVKRCHWHSGIGNSRQKIGMPFTVPWICLCRGTTGD